MKSLAVFLGLAVMQMAAAACAEGEGAEPTPVSDTVTSGDTAVTPGTTPAPATTATAATDPAGGLKIVTLAELLSNPDQYDGKRVLLEGFYFHGFETIVLSERLELSGYAEGHFWPQGQKIWIEGNAIPREVYDNLHKQEMMGPVERYGKLLITGRFEHGGGFGHGGGFDAQVVPSEIELLPWSPASLLTDSLAEDSTPTAAATLGDATPTSVSTPAPDTISGAVTPDPACGGYMRLLVSAQETYQEAVVTSYQCGTLFVDSTGRAPSESVAVIVPGEAAMEIRLEAEEPPTAVELRLYAGAGVYGSFMRWPELLPGGVEPLAKLSPAPSLRLKLVPRQPAGEYSLVVKATWEGPAVFFYAASVRME